MTCHSQYQKNQQGREVNEDEKPEKALKLKPLTMQLIPTMSLPRKRGKVRILCQLRA
jgi:hypothetical protein